MKLALSVLALVVACSAISQGDVYEKWVQYQRDFGKNYQSPVEARKRFEIFRNVVEENEKHNKLYEEGAESYLKGLSEYSDLTVEEFNQMFPRISQEELDGLAYSPDVLVTGHIEAADELNWTSVEGVVSPVKNQRQCLGYAFSVTGALEGLAKLALGQNLVLSEQAIMDCSHKYGNRGCEDGLTFSAFNFVRDFGIPTAESYPYTAEDSACKPFTQAFNISTFAKVHGDETRLKQVLAYAGPISINIDATQNLFGYQGGVFDDPMCTSEPNHSVLLVGYGTEEGKDYWLIKNSWGADWGPHGGYFKMLRGANKCAIMSGPAYPIL